MDFEKELEKIKTRIPIQDDLNEKDLIVQITEDMLIYGFVHKIVRDFATKTGTWWHITFTMLAVPLITTTLTLRTEQMTGKEIFTVGGKKRFFAAIDTDKMNSNIDPNPEKPVKKSGLRLVK